MIPLGNDPLGFEPTLSRLIGVSMLIAAASGGELAARKSRLAQELQKLIGLQHIMVVDDNALDAQHVTAILNLLLGRGISVVHHKSVPTAIADMRNRMPDLLFLDDVLPPLDRAESSLKSLHRHGLTAPVIIVTAMLTTSRRKELMALAPLGILHKDDIDSLSVGEVLLRLAADGDA